MINAGSDVNKFSRCLEEAITEAMVSELEDLPNSNTEYSYQNRPNEEPAPGLSAIYGCPEHGQYDPHSAGVLFTR